MDTRFFGSKYFAVAAAIAAAILVGGAGAYYLSGAERSFSTWDACGAPALGGAAIAVTPSRVIEDDGERRTETYSLNATDLVGGKLALCLDVGEIHVEPSETDEVSLEIVTFSGSARAVEETITRARFSKDDGGLVIGAWESSRATSRSLLDRDSASVRMTLRVPPSGSYQVTAVNDVGDIRLSGLMVEDAQLTTDVGTVLVRNVDVVGNLTLASDVGDAILHALSVTTGRIRVRADVGNAEAELPQRADIGYDATASTDVGEALIRIGDVEHQESEDHTPGERETARSSGFASKPTRVVVSATSDVGDARVVATGGATA